MNEGRLEVNSEIEKQDLWEEFQGLMSEKKYEGARDVIKRAFQNDHDRLANDMLIDYRKFGPV